MPPDASHGGTRGGLAQSGRNCRIRHPRLSVECRESSTRWSCWPTGRGIGYLVKSRVTDVAEFLDTLERIAKGGSVVDPALVQELVTARRRNDPLAALSTRERQVLELMAEGHSNAGIGRHLWVTEGTVEKHVRSILAKLDLPETADHHRRVLAVLTFLDTR